jgi:hypothetical protein
VADDDVTAFDPDVFQNTPDVIAFQIGAPTPPTPPTPVVPIPPFIPVIQFAGYGPAGGVVPKPTTQKRHRTASAEAGSSYRPHGSFSSYSAGKKHRGWAPTKKH